MLLGACVPVACPWGPGYVVALGCVLCRWNRIDLKALVFSHGVDLLVLMNDDVPSGTVESVMGTLAGVELVIPCPGERESYEEMLLIPCPI
jgi:hypothetical protein